MVREPISLSLLRSLGLPEGHGCVWPDLAFAFPAAPAAEAQEWLQLQGIYLASDKPLLGMTVLDWGAQNVRFARQAEYESACAEAARFFVEQCGGRVIVFPQVWGPSTPQDDRLAARRVAGLLADLGSLVLNVQEPLRPDLLKAVYGLMDLFVGTRMHSNIFALSQEVPVIAIGYQHKTRGIAQMVGLERWVVDIEQVDDETLVNMLADLWEKREAVHVHLRHVIPSLVEQASRAGSVIAADLAAQGKVWRE
jgi:colanic acid/amylovoran biosynthesis protein